MIDQPEPLDGKLLDEIDGVMQGYEHFRKDDVVRAVAWLKEQAFCDAHNSTPMRVCFKNHPLAIRVRLCDVNDAFVDCVKK